jgi:branched-chain amino acid transport system ATP-binding protein
MINGGDTSASDRRLMVEQLEVHRAGSPVVRGVSIEVTPGEITVLLGTNGAGKTTLLEAISGVIPATSGHVRLGDVDITRMARERRARAGLAHIEQGRAVFTDLTVEENLLVVARKGHYEHIFDAFPEIGSRRLARAGLLSGGEQQMLVIARALVNNPKVLMIDEMSLGLAPVVVKRLIPIVTKLAADGAAVLLVEQFAPIALSIGQRAYVLSRGGIAYDGDCQSLSRDPDQLRDIYLSSPLPN